MVQSVISTAKSPSVQQIPQAQSRPQFNSVYAGLSGRCDPPVGASAAELERFLVDSW
jgi:hypothetical protein